LGCSEGKETTRSKLNNKKRRRKEYLGRVRLQEKESPNFVPPGKFLAWTPDGTVKEKIQKRGGTLVNGREYTKLKGGEKRILGFAGDSYDANMRLLWGMGEKGLNGFYPAKPL